MTGGDDGTASVLVTLRALAMLHDREATALECDEPSELYVFHVAAHARITAAIAVLEDFKLPCDVRVPPAVIVGRGCGLSTLFGALETRAKTGP